MAIESWPPVSVIIPSRNAEDTIARMLDSVVAQDYAGELEVVVADGSDTSATVDLVTSRFPDVGVVWNRARSTPAALNRAIRATAHPIIVRCDAHAILPPGYISRAVETLVRTGAANVGGRQNPVGSTTLERAVSLAMTTPLGAGGARYRLGGPEGPTDTVYLGVFRREALESVGGFDETLLRNEDYELNWRLRKSGHTVWFDPRLVVDYRPRGTLGELARQYFDYGTWKRVVLGRHPGSWRYRQLAAPLLLVSLAGSVLLAVTGGVIARGGLGGGAWGADGGTLLVAGAACPIVYLMLLLVGSMLVGIRRRRPEAVLMPLVLATIHFAWGLGVLCGKPQSVPRNELDNGGG